MAPAESGFIPVLSGRRGAGPPGEWAQTGPVTDREFRRNAAGGDKAADAALPEVADICDSMAGLAAHAVALSPTSLMQRFGVLTQ
jgi:hypothetical protein